MTRFDLFFTVICFALAVISFALYRGNDLLEDIRDALEANKNERI